MRDVFDDLFVIFVLKQAQKGEKFAVNIPLIASYFNAGLFWSPECFGVWVYNGDRQARCIGKQS